MLVAGCGGSSKTQDAAQCLQNALANQMLDKANNNCGDATASHVLNSSGEKLHVTCTHRNANEYVCGAQISGDANLLANVPHGFYDVICDGSTSRPSSAPRGVTSNPRRRNSVIRSIRGSRTNGCAFRALHPAAIRAEGRKPATKKQRFVALLTDGRSWHASRARVFYMCTVCTCTDSRVSWPHVHVQRIGHLCFSRRCSTQEWLLRL